MTNKRYWLLVGQTMITNSCGFMLISMFIMILMGVGWILTGDLDVIIFTMFLLMMICSLGGILLGNILCDRNSTPRHITQIEIDNEELEINLD